MIQFRGFQLYNKVRSAIKQLRETDKIPIDTKYSREIYDTVKDYVNKVKYQDINANKTPYEVLSMVDDFVVGAVTGEDEYFTLFRYQDIKHYGYYDTFLYQGAAADIQQSLREAGLADSFLKSVRKKIAKDKNDVKQEWSENGFKIIQEWSEPEHGSPVVIRFEIWYNGKQIYEYKNQEIKTYQHFRKMEIEEKRNARRNKRNIK